ncbi:GOLD domain-containing protein [Trichonephila clavipes]|nr:GOLD domain-containing protein [Trichonephila clavipes]
MTRYASSNIGEREQYGSGRLMDRFLDPNAFYRVSVSDVYDITRAGDYQMCLDNSFSQYSSKTVYFEVSIDVNSEGYRWTMMNELLEADKKRNDTISRLKRTVNKVKDDLESIKHHQDTFRAVEARDINIQEKNLTKQSSYQALDDSGRGMEICNCPPKGISNMLSWVKIWRSG